MGSTDRKLKYGKNKMKAAYHKKISGATVLGQFPTVGTILYLP
jgi:hypothetical protein